MKTSRYCGCGLVGNKAHIDTVLGHPKDNAFDLVITSTILICDLISSMLFIHASTLLCDCEIFLVGT